MLSKRLALPLLVVAFARCAPHVTIADGASGAGGGGEGAAGGSSASGGTLGGATSSGGASTGGAPTAGSSTGDQVCYMGGGRGPVFIPCGGSPNGGSSTSVTGGTGTASGLPASCAQSLEPYLANFTACSVISELRYCAKGGCHNAATVAAGLNLVTDDFLIARILNVQATFQYAGPGAEECLPAGCPTQALVLDQASPEDSWMLRKMAPFVPGETMETLDMGCGDAMPTFNTTGTQGYSAASKSCLIQFFTALAREGTPCAPAVGAEPPERPPPCADGG